jgi:hypothetical protein
VAGKAFDPCPSPVLVSKPAIVNFASLHILEGQYSYLLGGAVAKKGYSPLDRGMKSSFGGGRFRLRKRIIAGVAVLLIAPYLSTSLAATITIQGTAGNAIEFGQGSQLAIACDTTINTAVTESWETSTSRFKVTSVRLSGINLAVDTATTTNNGGCGSKYLKLSLVDTATGVMTIGTGTAGQDSATAVMVLLPSNQITTPTTGPNGYLGGSTVAMTGTSASDATLTITLSTSLATSIDPARVGRVALETT